MEVTPEITITNEDNLFLMERFPKNYFDLAIVDPPYGLGIDGQKKSVNKNPQHNRKEHVQKNWDKNIPKSLYWRNLFRVSKNQIIWGANYFVHYLDEGKKGWIIWYKGQEGLTMSDAEIAYSSFDNPTRVVKINRVELLKQGTIHPTEKPIKLYEWLLKNYAKEGDKILDTHLGSGSIAIALDRINKIEQMNLTLTACELDKDYYESAIKRIREQTIQITIPL